MHARTQAKKRSARCGQASNTITVWNNGDGVPVEVHKEEKVYVPEMIFGHLLTSSNYNDNEKKARADLRGAPHHPACLAAMRQGVMEWLHAHALDTPGGVVCIVLLAAQHTCVLACILRSVSCALHYQNCRNQGQPWLMQCGAPPDTATTSRGHAEPGAHQVTGGRNGYGAKLANIFSKEFVIETCDGQRQRRYRQVFRANMTQKDAPAIRACKASENWTCVTFCPDLAKFGAAGPRTHDGDLVIPYSVSARLS